MNNKKMASELAIGIIVLVSIVIGGVFWVQNKKQESFEGLERVALGQQTTKPSELKNEPVKQDKNSNDDKCSKHLYEGEAQLRGSYVLDTASGSTKKEWMLKVVKEDMDKLPNQTKTQNVEATNDLLLIADATPEMITKLKNATESNPESITVKGIYFDCENIPVVSIGSAKTALAGYIKK